MDMKQTTVEFILKRQVHSLHMSVHEQQSIYSLEELFRHEFTHYLQGRYEVPGLFGRGDMYQNERLTWFQEGNAEFSQDLLVRITLYQERV